MVLSSAGAGEWLMKLQSSEDLTRPKGPLPRGLIYMPVRLLLVVGRDLRSTCGHLHRAALVFSPQGIYLAYPRMSAPKEQDRCCDVFFL